MKIGKVSQTVLKRSLLKPLRFKREEALFEPSIEEMCYGIAAEADEQVIAASSVLYGNEKDLGVFALAQAANDVATRGAVPIGAGVHIMLPPHAYESRIKAMIEYMEEASERQGIQILCAKAEVSPAVTTAIVFVTVQGLAKNEDVLRIGMGKADQDIVLLKWIGLEGTFRVLREKEEELSKRFVSTFLKQIQDLEPELFSVESLWLARKMGASAMQQITGGGILAALWEMAEASHVGIEVDLKKMSIRQETVEICEYCHLNPYQLTSAGSVLIFAEHGEEMATQFKELGIEAVVLGRTTQDTAKVILSNGEKRFLDRPVPDELLKIYE